MLSGPALPQGRNQGVTVWNGYADRNVNTTTRSVFGKLGLDYANPYSSREFRRGAFQELEDEGSQWSAAATVGGWRYLAFLRYVDLTLGVDRGMSKLLSETDPVGSDEEKVHLWVKGPLVAGALPMGVRAPLTIRYSPELFLKRSLSDIRNIAIQALDFLSIVVFGAEAPVGLLAFPLGQSESRTHFV